MLHQSLLLLLPVVYFRWHGDVGSGSHFDFMTILSGYNTTPPRPPLHVLLWLALQLLSMLSGQQANNATQDSASVLIRKGSQRFIALCFWLTSVDMKHCFVEILRHVGSVMIKVEGGGCCCPVRKWVRNETNCRWITPDMYFHCKVRLIHF